MIERMDDMPPGTIGLRASGRLTRDDYRHGLEPALHEAVGSGEVRLVFVLTDFEGLAPSALPEDIQTGLRAWAHEHSAWRRMALVTDVEWVARSMRTFAWLSPGEIRTYPLEQLEDAKHWVAG
jgi:hypothetical protein